MSVPSSPVVVQKKIPLEAMSKMRLLTRDAVTRAIQKARDEIAAYAMGDDSNVPVDTGRLRRSFTVGTTPSFMVMRWSAIDPRSGYDYALVQDIGRENMWGKHYSEVTMMVANQILLRCLEEELQAMEVGA